jgi:hypothetical protein
MKTIHVALFLILAAALAEAGPYRVLLESNADEPSGDEVWIGSFGTYQGLIDGVYGGEFSDFNINPDWSVGGLAYDGQYRVLLESNADEPSGDEVWIGTFGTYQDLIDGVYGGEFSDFNINPDWSVGGLIKEAGPAAVPLPPAALVGLGLLVTLGAARRLRRRKS